MMLETKKWDPNSCRHEDVRRIAAPGRRTRYRNIVDLVIPADLALPTCVRCGEWLLTRESAIAFDRAMQPLYTQELCRKAQDALAALAAQGVRQRDLEPLLGLSAGYLSKLKNGKAEPSASLVATLMLLAVEKRRLRELESLWPAGIRIVTGEPRMVTILRTLPQDPEWRVPELPADAGTPAGVSVAALSVSEAA